jgi:hypothetical protein
MAAVSSAAKTAALPVDVAHPSLTGRCTDPWERTAAINSGKLKNAPGNRRILPKNCKLWSKPGNEQRIWPECVQATANKSLTPGCGDSPKNIRELSGKLLAQNGNCDAHGPALASSRSGDYRHRGFPLSQSAVVQLDPLEGDNGQHAITLRRVSSKQTSRRGVAIIKSEWSGVGVG